VRFAKMGSVEPYRGEAEGIAGVLVCPQTKSGDPLRTAVSAEVLEAGNRLLERGSFSFEKYTLAIKGACTAAGIPAFPPGWFRHSVATWAIGRGQTRTRWQPSSTTRARPPREGSTRRTPPQRRFPLSPNTTRSRRAPSRGEKIRGSSSSAQGAPEGPAVRNEEEVTGRY
jgi:hypothetical protein